MKLSPETQLKRVTNMQFGQLKESHKNATPPDTYLKLVTNMQFGQFKAGLESA